MKPKLLINFEKTDAWDGVEEFFEKPEERITDFQNQSMRDIAGKYSTRVRKKIPRERYLSEYRNSIHAVETNEESDVAVIADADRIKIRKLDPRRNVLEFRQANKKLSVGAFGKFLIKNSPFPIDMVRKRPLDVEVFYKRVSEREVSILSHKKGKLVGRMYVFEKEKGLMELVSVMPDLTFMALRTEFSMQGYTGAAHWRPSIKEIRPDEDISKRTEKIFTEPTKGYRTNELKGKVNENDLDKKFIKKIVK